MGNLYQQNRKYFLLGFVLFLYALVITPLLIINLQKQQTLRGQAADPTPTPALIDASIASTPQQGVCSNSVTDTVLIIDRSGSMSGSKLAAAKSAAKLFVDKVSANPLNRVALVQFSDTGTLLISFTSNFSSVKSKIDSITVGGGTCVVCGINKANTEITTYGRSGVKKAVILLSDGRANYIEGKKSVSTSVAENAAIDAVKAGFNASKSVFYTIGLGTNVTASFLQQIANLTGGKYYFAPTEAQLAAIYTDISIILGKGSVQGTIFNDTNKNGVQDTGETGLSGWKVELKSQTGATPTTYTSDSLGVYTAGNLCDGQYTVKLVLQSGWNQTVPTDANGYTFTIASGTVLDYKNFGVNQTTYCNDTLDNDNNGYADTNDSSCHSDGNPKNPTSYVPTKDGEKGGGGTCADSKDNNNNGLIDGGDPVCHTDGDPNKPYDPSRPEDSLSGLSLTVLLDGIGSRGDNTNPTASSFSNKNPQHKTKETEVTIFNASNELVATINGSIAYNAEDGNFKGTLSSDKLTTSGTYLVRIKVKGYLRKLVDGIQNLKVGQPNEIPTTALVTGDINSDNKIDILDYNLLLDCYSDLAVAPNCADPAKKTQTDINDDGLVNQFDYNLFLREISTQPGE